MIGRFVDLSKIPKDLRGKSLVMRKQTILLFNLENEPSLVDNIEFGSWRKKAAKRYSSAFLFSYQSIPIEIPIECNKGGEIPLYGILHLDVGIRRSNPRRALDRIAKTGSGEIDGFVVSDIIAKEMEGDTGGIFKDLKEEEIRDPEAAARVRNSLSSWLMERMPKLGLTFIGDPRMDWGETENERQTREAREVEVRQQDLLGKVEEGAADFLANEGLQKKLGRERARKLAKERHIRDMKAIDAAKFEREEERKAHLENMKTLEEEAGAIRRGIKADEDRLKEALDEEQRRKDEEEEAKLDAKKAGIEAGRKVVEAAGEAEADRIAAAGEAEADRIAREAAEKKAEFRRKMRAEQDDLYHKYVNENGWDLKTSFKMAYEGSIFVIPINEFVTNKLTEVMSGHAEDIDENIKSLQLKLDSPDDYLTDSDKSFIWAGIACLQLARGAKGDRMEEALDKSMELNPKNPLAAQCWLDYLLSRNRPAMVRGNYKAKYKSNLKQMSEAFDVLFDLNTKHLTESELNRYRQERKICLSQLAEDENQGDKWKAELERLYG